MIGKPNNRVRNCFGLFLFFISTHLSADPVWSFVPDSTYPPTVFVPSDESVIIKYLITNNSAKAHSMKMNPIAGVYQIPNGVGVCGEQFNLSSHQSCTLTLYVDGSTLGANIIGGPVICHLGSVFQCYQPSPENSLKIIKIDSKKAGLTVSPSTLLLEAKSATPGKITVTNNSMTITANDVHLNLPDNWTDITLEEEECINIAPNSSCQITVIPGETIYSEETVYIKGCNTKPEPVTISVNPPTETSLSLSSSNLALSVNNPQLNAALTGQPRQILITNTGTSPAYKVTYSVENLLLSQISSITPASCGKIRPNETCALTITPGNEATSTPVKLTIAGVNTNPIVSEIHILSYGSIYQSGYVFSINDDYASFPITGSVGGKLVTLADQALGYPVGVVWSSKGNSSGTNDVDYHSIYGIDETSTTTNPSPKNTPILAACNGRTDGACNSANIVEYYTNHYETSVNLLFYAAGHCKQAIGGYSDWYLPAICELGPDSGYNICNLFPVEQNIVDNLPFLLNKACSGPSCLSGFYWSSTAYSIEPQDNAAWGQYFKENGGSLQNSYDKNYQQGVRCVRAIT